MVSRIPHSNVAAVVLTSVGWIRPAAAVIREGRASIFHARDGRMPRTVPP